MIIKIAFRNLFRQRRRSLLTALSMIVGFILLALSLAFSEGGYGHIIEIFTHSHTGHIQIHKAGYLERPNIHKSFEYSDNLTRLIESVPEVQAAAPRVYCGAIAFIDEKTTGVQLIGVDPILEPRLSTLADKVGQGEFFNSTFQSAHASEFTSFDLESDSASPYNPILIGNGVARILKAELGSEVAMVSQGSDGSIANDLFTVVGILKKEVDSTDRNKAYAPIDSVREFMAMDTRVHEMALILPSHKQARQVADDIRDKLTQTIFLENNDHPDEAYLEVHPWEEVEALFYRSMTADKKGNWVFLFIIGLIVALGVLNTVLMSILERTREFGVMRAVGTRPSRILFQIVLESLLLSVTASVVGTLCSVPMIWPFVEYGLPVTQSMTIGGISISSFKAGFVFEAFWMPFAVIVGTATLISVLPAIRAARIKPVDAMRTY